LYFGKLRIYILYDDFIHLEDIVSTLNGQEISIHRPKKGKQPLVVKCVLEYIGVDVVLYLTVEDIHGLAQELSQYLSKQELMYLIEDMGSSL
jgi:selenocysteine lyase/cysteine desulfurase